MARIATFTVVPRLPAPLEPLRTAAYNMSWCWDPESIELFFRIDRDLWVASRQNPVLMLGVIGQERLEQLAKDDSFIAHLARVKERLNTYLTSSTWYDKSCDAPKGFQVGYFSAEFGIHESISIYGGGLGLLAGDHVKSASDLGLPMVGVGLMYREGYHQQYLNADGWQQERYPRNDLYNMAVTLERDGAGNPVVIDVEYPERAVHVRAWRCQVGRIPVFLLDSDFEANDQDDREITARLYGGDRDMRIRQEIILGTGGVKLLRALNIVPTVYHMNEGHSAFMTLERVREYVVNEGCTFDHAFELVKASSVFTTHTPVPAGNDMFAPEMIARYFGSYAQHVGITLDKLLALGRQDPADSREPFCMTVLALRASAHSNAVSKLHGETARGMWSRAWPGIPKQEVPITSITNGVHPRFWVSRDMAGLFDRYIGPDWISQPMNPEVWQRIDHVPDAELWRTHERRRERLINFARIRFAAQLQRRGAPQREIQLASEVLDPEVLTIGFARRFAAYKRANLFLMDQERLRRLLTDETRPFQMIIAGKAHPADNQGKELIRQIIHFAHDASLRHRIIFLEDYDINVARYMVQGVDCWLNTPRRPMEASGTSGMKAAANGALNISIPDGWWCEAEGLGENGWSIGRGEVYESPEEQDKIESQTLYEILEREVAPMFYQSGHNLLPREWVHRMKSAIKTISPVFNTHRMVQDYTQRFYVPATARSEKLNADNRAHALALTEWKARVRSCWDKVHFTALVTDDGQELTYGTSLSVSATLYLGKLTDQDVTVEVYYGDLDPYERIPEGETRPMDCVERKEGDIYVFKGEISCAKTGRHGLTVRAIPHHPDLAEKHETALIVWA
jgi:glycogen phosphorylase